MSGPWDKYQAPAAQPDAGPWAKYAAPKDAGPEGSFIDPLMQGLSLYSADEAAGLFGGAADWMKGKSFGEGYKRQRDLVRGKVADYEKKHPVASAVGEIAGSLPTAVLPMGAAMKGAGMATKMLESAAGSGLYGGITGWMGGEGSTSDRLASARDSALVTGGIGAGIPIVGKAVSKIVRPAAKIVGDVAERAGLSKEFNVPLSRGQLTGGVRQQAKEERLKHGAFTRGSFENFIERQHEAADQAAENVQRGIAGQHPPIASPAEGGTAAVEGVEQEAARREAEGHRLYDEADAAGVTVPRSVAADAPKSVMDRLNAVDVVVDDKLHPAATIALNEINKLGGIGDGVSPEIALREVDRVRRRAMQMKGANPDDARVLRAIKGAYDDWFADAVDNQLMSGDPKGFDALRKARETWAFYRSITSPRSGDDAGRKIAMMVNKDVTGQEAANWIVGSAALGGSGTAYRVARRLQGILGPDSPEWAAVRQSAWLALTKAADGRDQPGSQKISSNIFEFVNGKGKPVAEVMFSPEERAMMARFASLHKSMVPNPRATNPSKSGYVVANALKMVTAGILGQLGFVVGGPIGTVALPLGGAIAAGVKSSISARRAINPNINRLVSRAQRAANSSRPGVTNFMEIMNRASVPALMSPTHQPLDITVPIPAGQ